MTRGEHQGERIDPETALVRETVADRLPQQKRYAFDPAEFIGWWGELSKRDR